VLSNDLLVTGASGFVGGWVMERARRAGLSAYAASGDLRDPSIAARAVRESNPGAVIHAAAAPRDASPWVSLGTDLMMAGNIVQAVAQHAPDAAVLIPGSAAQYGMGSQERLAEEDPTVPVSSYGAAKCVLEQAVLADPLRAGVRIVWARSFNLIGPRQTANAPAAQWALQIVSAEHAGGGPLRTGRLDVVRDFLDVREVSDAYIALVRVPAAAGVVNVCSGVPTPLSTLADAMIEAASVPISLSLDPELRRRLDPPRVVGDPSRLQALTDWTPNIELAESVRDMLDECRAVSASVSR
jgi:GDP-4-dehydro-6-deoxy-D-mannose reductase